MITVLESEPKFEYDIRALVKAFFIEEEVKVVKESDSWDYLVTYKPDEILFESRDGRLKTSAAVTASMERPEVKNVLKRMIYKALSKLTGKTLAWGDLSGIRPTKIPMKLINEGMNDDKILRFMEETYLVSREKAKLSLDIARKEIEVLKPIHHDGYSMYIGIPFCPTTCLYCSFTSNPIALWAGKTSKYLEALFKEIEYVALARKNQILDTIYIGGGTPTTLSAEELDRLLTKIEEEFDLINLSELTVEAGRADSITIDKLRTLKRHNVTRISVNPQTMNEKTLKLIGRRHTVEDVERAFHDARSEGFDNINMDIILGLPEEGPKEVSNTIERILKLSPDSLTVHSLAIKRASKMSEWIQINGCKTMINTDETMKIAAEGARAMGMEPYYLYRQKDMAGNFENTGYSRPGAEGIYNILIMEELQTIAALGPGSVSKVLTPDKSLVRDDNVKDVKLYIETIDAMIERKRKLFELEKLG